MDTVQKIPQDPAAAFSISDLAERTGLSAATLRTWETRHGFPEPVRRPGGHRRYTEHHVSQVRQVLEHRARGLTLEAAIAATTREAAATDHSVFAGVRRRHPALVTRTLRKSTLLALTHAMEDECCARSREPLLVAGFQDERFLRQAEARWRELSRTAHAAVVFAALTAPHEPAPVRRCASTCPTGRPCAASGSWSATPRTSRRSCRRGRSPASRPSATPTAASRPCGASTPPSYGRPRGSPSPWPASSLPSGPTSCPRPGVGTAGGLGRPARGDLDVRPDADLRRPRAALMLRPSDLSTPTD